MRVASDTNLLEVDPGSSTAFTIDVVNTDNTIAGISTKIIGLADEYVTATPQMLPLFPDSTGQVRLGVVVPPTHPAGRHPLTVEVVPHGTTSPPGYLDVDLDVAAHPGLRVMARPRVVRARRQARYVVELANSGNVALDVAVSVIKPDRQIQVTCIPDTRRLEPGAVAPVLVTVRGPRMFTGAEIERTVDLAIDARAVAVAPASMPTAPTGPTLPTGPDGARVALNGNHVNGNHADADTTVMDAVFADPAAPTLLADPPPAATGAPAPVAPVAPTPENPTPENPTPGQPLPDDREDGAPPTDAGGEFAVPPTLTRVVSLRLRQKPTISRGLLTVFILLAIIALWAAIFLLGLAKVFAADPITKQAPASFFASTPGAAPGGGGNDGGSAGANGSGDNGGAPAGALSKSGQVPPGTGGEITGKITSAADRQPVGRILVTAFRRSRDGLRQMSSAASQSDGTFTLAGLYPTDYYLRFSRSGFRTQWYANRPSVAGAQPVSVMAQGTTSGIDATVAGNPASISGRIDPGDTTGSVVTTVTARPLLGARTGQAIATATSTGGSYTLSNLPAPATYELTFTTPGYQASTLVDAVSGGDRRLEPTVTLGAGAGQIAGTVSDNGRPLGGATVSTTLNGRTYTVGTPTTGAVGSFVLGNLPTPATYVVRVSSPGHGSVTQIVDLAAGQSRSGLAVRLDGSVGSVSGIVLDADGNPVGGAKVTVGGAAAAATPSGQLSTVTLTAGEPGAFALNGLRNGSYTLSVTLAGYATASVPVTVSNGTAPRVVVRLADRLGGISGRITRTGGASVAGATVTARTATRSWITTSRTLDGRYEFAGLPPGSYSVTVTSAGLAQQTALVTVRSGHTADQNLRLGGS